MTSGRFVLLMLVERNHAPGERDVYITSWDTWEECEVAFPLPPDTILQDCETGREWWPGSNYEWEAART